jgi:hypothetical protein
MLQAGYQMGEKVHGQEPALHDKNTFGRRKEARTRPQGHNDDTPIKVAEKRLG